MAEAAEEVRARLKPSQPRPPRRHPPLSHRASGLCGIHVHVQGADAVRYKLNVFGPIVGQEKDFRKNRMLWFLNIPFLVFLCSCREALRQGLPTVGVGAMTRRGGASPGPRRGCGEVYVHAGERSGFQTWSSTPCISAPTPHAPPCVCSHAGAGSP